MERYIRVIFFLLHSLLYLFHLSFKFLSLLQHSSKSFSFIVFFLFSLQILSRLTSLLISSFHHSPPSYFLIKVAFPSTTLLLIDTFHCFFSIFSPDLLLSLFLHPTIRPLIINTSLSSHLSVISKIFSLNFILYSSVSIILLF